jgi:hypothetical protein
MVKRKQRIAPPSPEKRSVPIKLGEYWIIALMRDSSRNPWRFITFNVIDGFNCEA